jgi:hypothetical protein
MMGVLVLAGILVALAGIRWLARLSADVAASWGRMTDD